MDNKDKEALAIHHSPIKVRKNQIIYKRHLGYINIFSLTFS